MTKSRMTLVPLVSMLALPGPAWAGPPVTAEAAVQNYRRAFPSVAEIDCPTGDGDEIVVCGRPQGAPDPHRLPLPVGREPGHLGATPANPRPAMMCWRPSGASDPARSRPGAA